MLVNANVEFSKSLKMNNNQPEIAKPVTIISGFLGAGKKCPGADWYLSVKTLLHRDWRKC